MPATRLTTSTTTSAGSYFIVGGQGDTIASASSITISSSFHEISGSTTINTINGGIAGMELFLYRPTGASWTIGTSGNINGAASTAAERVVMLVTPDGSNWYAIAANDDIDDLTGTLAIDAGGTGQTTATAAFDALAPTTTQGDIIYHDGTDNVRLAKGTTRQLLQMNTGATAPEWTSTLLTGAGSAATPAVSLGATTSGLYQYATNEVGVSSAGTAKFRINGSGIWPVTNNSVSLGSSTLNFASAYSKAYSGGYLKNLSTSFGANDFADFQWSAGLITSLIGFKIIGVVVADDASGETACYMGEYNVVGARDAGSNETTAISSIIGGIGSPTTGGGTVAFTMSAAISSDQIRLTCTTSGTITPTSIALYWMYVSPQGVATVTEL